MGRGKQGGGRAARLAVDTAQAVCYIGARQRPWPVLRTAGTSAFCGGGDRKIERDVRLNERIRAREVRLIDESGAQLGVMATREALRIARERELDLIEVAPNAQPPVCRIMDYGKHRYQQAKREREAHRRSKGTEVRVLVFRNPRIDPHDLQIKLRKLRELLGEGNKVRINLRMRGRELSHPEMGTQLLARIGQELSEIAHTEMPARLEGRMMSALLAPKPQAKPAPPPKPAAPPREKPPAEPKPAPAVVEPAAGASPAPQGLAEKAIPDVKEQVQQEQVEPRRQAEDAEDSGEAG